MRRFSIPNDFSKRVAVGAAWALLFLTLVVAGCTAGYRLCIEAVEKLSPREAAPANGRWILAHDVNVYVQEFGLPQGKPLVLVHGTGAWSGTWGVTCLPWCKRGIGLLRWICRRLVSANGRSISTTAARHRSSEYWQSLTIWELIPSLSWDIPSAADRPQRRS